MRTAKTRTPLQPRMSAAQLRAHYLRQMSEDAVQRTIVVLLEAMPPPPIGPWWTAVNPLPGKRTKSAAGRMKWLGLRAGAPDLVLCWSGRFAGVEVKRPVGGRTSVDQLKAQAEIDQAGGAVTVVRSAQEFVDFLDTNFPTEWRRLAPHDNGIRPWWVTP